MFGGSCVGGVVVGELERDGEEDDDEDDGEMMMKAKMRGGLFWHEKGRHV